MWLPSMHATGPKMLSFSAISRVPEYILPVHSVTGTPLAINAAMASASRGCTLPSAPSSVPSISVTKTRGFSARVVLVGNRTVDQREQRVVTTHADVAARVDGLTDLANQDAASTHGLAAIHLHTTVLGIRATTVTRRAAAFFMCHYALTPVILTAVRFWR